MNRSKLSKLSDRELVDAVIQGDESAIGYFFYEKFNALFSRNLYKVAANKNVVLEDLVQDLYIHLSKNDWERLKRYDEDCGKLLNWLSVVSYLFFKDKTASLIDSAPRVPIEEREDIPSMDKTDSLIEKKYILKIIEKLHPPRYRDVVDYLILKGRDPGEVAKELGVNIDNLYNIKSKALAKLRRLLLDDNMKKEWK